MSIIIIIGVALLITVIVRAVRAPHDTAYWRQIEEDYVLMSERAEREHEARRWAAMQPCDWGAPEADYGQVGGALDEEQARYCTRDEAEQGHAAMLARVREAEH